MIKQFWFAIALALAPAAALAMRVEGVVVDKAGQPIELVTLTVPAQHVGAVTDEQGHFVLNLPAGAARILARRLGYEGATLEVQVAESLAPLRVQLHDAPLPLSEVTVTTSAYGSSGKSEGAVVGRSDVYTTPGGAADIFQSLRALPGLNAPVEGAAVYVRGGDPRETLIRLDGGDLGHPYHYEGASGGLFSSMNAYMLKSAFFSSGGYSAKYGGALSGVLDIQTQNDLDARAVTLGANVTGGELDGTWSLKPGRAALMGSVRMSAPELLFRLYGSPREYESAPQSRDVAAKLLTCYSSTGRLNLTVLGSSDNVGVQAQYYNYEGTYHDHSNTHYTALELRDVLAEKVAVSAQASWQRYRSRWTFGPVGASQDEDNLQAGADAVWSASSRHELSAGATWRRPDVHISGSFAVDSTDYSAGAPSRTQDARVKQAYPGGYVEDKLRLFGSVYATLGIRADFVSRPSAWTSDPRGALAWLVTPHQTLRVAAGRYHELPDPKYQDPVYGNSELQPLEADHLIAGYQWKTEQAEFRVEAYHKKYRDLVATDSLLYYSNAGHGFADGVDVFLQGVRGRFSGWVSYGYLNSKRQELDSPAEVPSPYGLQHSLTLVGRVTVARAWQLGAHYNYGSGRPYTPVVGATYDDARGTWKPVLGARYSARLPEYNRLDVRVMRLFRMGRALGLPSSQTCVVYIEAMNVLGIRNVMDYSYNADYSERRRTESYFSRRFLVGGFSLTW